MRQIRKKSSCRKKAQKAQEQFLGYSDDPFALFALFCG
jgi:hypothetical protein